MGSGHSVPGPLITVVFPLACSPSSPTSCLPLHMAAGLSSGRDLAQGSYNPPDPSRRVSSATAHLFLKHVLWRLGKQLRLVEEECDLVAVLPVSFRQALSLPVRSGLLKRWWPGATLALLGHRVGKEVLSTHWPRGSRFAEAGGLFPGGSEAQDGGTEEVVFCRQRTMCILRWCLELWRLMSLNYRL